MVQKTGPEPVGGSVGIQDVQLWQGRETDPMWNDDEESGGERVRAHMCKVVLKVRRSHCLARCEMEHKIVMRSDADWAVGGNGEAPKRCKINDTD